GSRHRRWAVWGGRPGAGPRGGGARRACGGAGAAPRGGWGGLGPPPAGGARGPPPGRAPGPGGVFRGRWRSACGGPQVRRVDGLTMKANRASVEATLVLSEAQVEDLLSRLEGLARMRAQKEPN